MAGTAMAWTSAGLVAALIRASSAVTGEGVDQGRAGRGIVPVDGWRAAEFGSRRRGGAESGAPSARG